jgi:arylsulfatase A-like enzyme
MFRLIFVIAAISFMWAGTLRTAPAAAQPDILIIMPDQFRGDCLSAVGHPVVRTPNIDQLAADGALFRRAYATVPSCIPARFALLTSLYPPTSGVVGFRSRPITVPTLPQVLGEAGYTTVLVGRTMHQNPPNKSVGFGQEILGSTYVSHDEYDQYLRQAAPQSGGIQKLVESLHITYNGWHAAPWPLADDLHPTAWTVRQARKTVADAPAEKPLFLTASFYAPHSPLFPPKAYFDAMMKADLPPPARGDWVDWPKLRPAQDLKGDPDRVLLEGELAHRAEAGYFGLIEHLDAQIAPLIADFKARSAKAGRPWVIVFIADHGEMLGDHGYYRKCEPYEGSDNIPFIVAGSRDFGFTPGLRSMQPVCLEDVMPTLLELAGVKHRPSMDGVNLVPALRGQDQTIRPWLHTEHAPCYSVEQAFHALNDGRWKYIWRPESGREQLFDLNADPREEHDLAPDPAQRATLDHWRGILIQALAHRPEGFSDGTKLIPGRRYLPIEPGTELLKNQK